jgi:5-(carboxyamino)imidazole ribonucleotide synthase
MTAVVPPGMVGMLGGGQLGRYALIAARQMGYRTAVLDPDPHAPAKAVADLPITAAFDDEAALAELAEAADVVTTEFENPPSTALGFLAARTRVAPSPAAVAIAQDRILEKRFLVEAGLPVGPYAEVVAIEDEPAVGYPAILKTARLGYDGKGQRGVDDVAGMRAAWRLLGSVPCVLETELPLDTELSVVAARTANGHVATYAVCENRHVDGILDLTVVPAGVPRRLADRAAGLAMTIVDALDYVGVLAVEMFVVGTEILVNELAPRPHNSGHWTLDAARTSQFAQQIRAVCGTGLGDTSMTARGAAMVNLLGDLWEQGAPDWERVLADGSAALHLYGKREARPGRKMGHITTWAGSAQAAATLALQSRAGLVQR